MRLQKFFSMGTGAVALVLSIAACDSSSGSASPTGSEAAVTSIATTTSTTPPPPPPLTHKQFIQRLDRLCRIGNRASDRKFSSDVNLSDTAESMDFYARLLARANRFIRKWDRRHGFFKLAPGDPKDIRDYRSYKVLTRRLRNFSMREQVAARRHDFEEIVRLVQIENRTRNQRTRLTADMGLRYCGP